MSCLRWFSRVRRATLVALALTVPFLACEADSSGNVEISIEEGTGVEIVQTHSPLWGEGEAWQVSDDPIVRIGTIGGDLDYQLHRVMDVTRLSDGGIVVANSGTGQVRFYDAEGIHLLDAGKEGDGPGEFRFLSRIWKLRADSIAAFDSFSGRVSIFDSEGQMTRSTQLSMVEELGRPTARAGFSDGSILSLSGSGGLTPQEGRIEGNTWIYSRYGADGTFLNKIGEGPGGPRWGTDYLGRSAFPYLPLVLGIPPGTADQTSLYLGGGTKFEIEKRSLDGTLVRIIRWDAELRAVTSGIVDDYKTNYVDAVSDPDGRPMAARWLEELPFPEYFPAYEELRADHLGNLWVKPYRAWWEDPADWWIFDSQGRWLGEISIPTDFRIDEIGEDYLLGVWRDENRVEYAAMFALTRGGA